MGHTQRVNSADDALSYFAACRTDTRLRGHSQGVETPSQVRYVKQLWQHLQQTGSWCPKSVPECKAPTLCLQALEFVDGLILHPEKVGRIKVLVQCGGGTKDLE